MTKEEKKKYMHEYCKTYYQTHRDKIKDCSNDRRKLKPESVADGKRRWYAAIKKDSERYSKLKETATRNRLLRKYGLTVEEHATLIKEQGGKCALCGKKQQLVVDHCHATGVVRGMLCRGCNGFLGAIGDDYSVVEKLARYFGRKI
jgi:hypothetical protein